MKDLRIILYLLLVMTTVTGLKSQTLAKIQNTNISLDNDRIIITYDLVDAQPGEKFEVWLNITDVGGVLIQGRRFSGDIGNNIEGGEGLVIYWNFEEDNVTLSDEISIQVMAKSLYKKELSYIKVLALSTVVPGWGLARMEDKKLYGLIGLAGYGFIAAGLVYTLNSKNTYKDYDNSNLITERETLYNDYVSKKNTGEILGWSAAAIWVADIVWMSLRYGTSKDDPRASLSRRITTGFTVCPVSETPVLSMIIRF